MAYRQAGGGKKKPRKVEGEPYWNLPPRNQDLPKLNPFQETMGIKGISSGTTKKSSTTTRRRSSGSALHKPAFTPSIRTGEAFQHLPLRSIPNATVDSSEKLRYYTSKQNLTRNASQGAGKIGLSPIKGAQRRPGTSSGTTSTLGRNKKILLPSEVVPSTEASAIHFTSSCDTPGVVVVYRDAEIKAVAPERLNLDRRGLTSFPLLEGEQKLRLLNMQNNSIKRIENLYGLPHLIFLDLYNNQIEEMNHLHLIPTLRVLMLGKNKLKSIGNLECLPNLDVLDLHSNEIKYISNLHTLKELRVLNLAGNFIKTVENLKTLSSLTEINLRRNLVQKVLDLGDLPALKTVFLSDNQISSVSEIDSLLQSQSVAGLSLDSNTIAEQDGYRLNIAEHLPSLRVLDQVRLSDGEKKAASAAAKLRNERRWETQRADQQEKERDVAIHAVKTMWNRTFGDQKEQTVTSPWDTKPRRRSFTPEAAVPAEMTAGFSEVEVAPDDEECTLYIYGNAMEVLLNENIKSMATRIVLRYVPIGRVVEILKKENIISWRRLKICSGFQTCHKLTIMNNSILDLQFLSSFLSANFKFLKVFNGKKLKQSDDDAALEIEIPVRTKSSAFDPKIKKRSADLCAGAVQAVCKVASREEIFNQEFEAAIQSGFADIALPSSSSRE